MKEKTKTITLVVEITMPDNVPDNRAIEMLGEGFLDQLQDCFGEDKTAQVKTIHGRNTHYIGAT